ncbi:glycosyltransferase family 4 protein [Pseudalkalibacillus berkeleyi]|uniref:Glycosyltransferase family 4 protein n=1 Tax=Pseudalkalibacillus berkeleyi TaxID=1069813 RepID=A0ABS9H4W7_9BACL|nr:glycosyltransferase family 4 protein [Pseudalkalibacillus berkeleyi]MCF6138730.1 glycosyltransferase family 4 protein [Pseudalkalibacillus berkeleyi]
MKIVQFITRMDDIGGAQIHLLHLSIGLARRGHHVTVIANEKGPLFDELNQNNIACIEIPELRRTIHPYFDLRALYKIRSVLKQANPHLLAIHSTKAGVIGRILGQQLKIPTIFTAHGWSFSEGIPERKRRMYIYLERLIGRISQGIITVSDYDYQLALQHDILPENKLQTIYNGIPDIKRPLSSQRNMGPPTIVMVARFAYPKDHLTVIKALEKLGHMRWKLSLVGDGPRLSDMKSIVKKSKISDRVTFMGAIRHVNQVLNDSDIFVLMSKHEGLPISIIEGMRSGLPIVASNVGGVKEMVRDNWNGYLIPEGDVDTLAIKLSTLISNQELMLKMGEFSRKRYEERFTYDRMFSDTLNYYKKISFPKNQIVLHKREESI